jgi:hypothetical protein
VLNKEIHDIKENPMFILTYTPELKLKEGNYGSLKSSEVRVVQIVDGWNMLVSTGDKRIIWFNGFSTAGLVEDELVVGAPLVICTGTKEYKNASGATTKVFVVEPLEVQKWVGVEEVPVQPPARLDPAR